MPLMIFQVCGRETTSSGPCTVQIWSNWIHLVEIWSRDQKYFDLGDFACMDLEWTNLAPILYRFASDWFSLDMIRRFLMNDSRQIQISASRKIFLLFRLFNNRVYLCLSTLRVSKCQKNRRVGSSGAGIAKPHKINHSSHFVNGYLQNHPLMIHYYFIDLFKTRVMSLCAVLEAEGARTSAVWLTKFATNWLQHPGIRDKFDKNYANCYRAMTELFLFIHKIINVRGNRNIRFRWSDRTFSLWLLWKITLLDGLLLRFVAILLDIFSR